MILRKTSLRDPFCLLCQRLVAADGKSWLKLRSRVKRRFDIQLAFQFTEDIGADVVEESREGRVSLAMRYKHEKIVEL